MGRRTIFTTRSAFLVLFSLQIPCVAQIRPFVGAAGAITTLSADGASQPIPQGINISLYKPENGPGFQAFAGVHLNDWFSVQGNYIWRRNDLVLQASGPIQGQFYSEQRRGTQKGFVADLLVYFRPVKSRVRPYLAVGTGVVELQSSRTAIDQLGSLATVPPIRFSSVRPVLDVPVGIDLAICRHLAFRYSFSETRRHNDFSDQLSPPGKRSLLDFQNMFGFVFQR